MHLEPIDPPANWRTLEPHPLAEFFPPADQDILRGIQASMEATGYRAERPIVLYEGTILDGRNRHAMWKCAESQNKKMGPPVFVGFEGSLDEAKRYVVSENMHRRDLTKIMWVIIARQIDGFKKEQHGGPRLSAPPRPAWMKPEPKQPATEQVRNMRTCSAAAMSAIGCVSMGTVRRGDAAIAKLGPKRVTEVTRGIKKLSQAMKEASKPIVSPTKPGTVDDAGHPIHARARAALSAGRGKAKELINAVRALKRDVLAYAAGDYGRALHAQSLETDFDNIARTLRFAAPYSSCPLGDPCDEHCLQCRGTQWVTEGQYSSIPKTLRLVTA